MRAIGVCGRFVRFRVSEQNNGSNYFGVSQTNVIKRAKAMFVSSMQRLALALITVTSQPAAAEVSKGDTAFLFSATAPGFY